MKTFQEFREETEKLNELSRKTLAGEDVEEFEEGSLKDPEKRAAREKYRTNKNRGARDDDHRADKRKEFHSALRGKKRYGGNQAIDKDAGKFTPHKSMKKVGKHGFSFDNRGAAQSKFGARDKYRASQRVNQASKFKKQT